MTASIQSSALLMRLLSKNSSSCQTSPGDDSAPGQEVSETEFLIAEVLAAMKGCRVSEPKGRVKNNQAAPNTASSQPPLKVQDEENKSPATISQSCDMEDERSQPRYRSVVDLYGKTAMK